MAGLRVFISSTCADLDVHRAQLRALLLRMGYEPIMSDHSEVLFDPSLHTHASCLRDVENADLVVLLIGARFGGTTVTHALGSIDFDKLAKRSTSTAMLDQKDKISITQAEILTAVQLDKPIFAFVDSRVYADHFLYSSNKDQTFLKKIKFPSITSNDTALSVFQFVDFIKHRASGNALIAYHEFSDIEGHLLKQWSLYFQRLLHSQRDADTQASRVDQLSEKIDDLKAAVIQTISGQGAKEIALNVVKFRRLVDFLLVWKTAFPELDFESFQGQFNELLLSTGYEYLYSKESAAPPFKLVFVWPNRFIGVRGDLSYVIGFEEDWEAFKVLSSETKEAIIDAVKGASAGTRAVEVRDEIFEQYRDSHANRPSEQEDALGDTLIDEGLVEEEAAARPKPRRKKPKLR
jgi:hypothetical protein